MSKHETYMFQHNVNSPVETFTDKPMTCDGHKITPGWCWSDGFRKYTRASFAKVKDNNDHRDARTEAYKNWYSDKFGREYEGEYTY